MIYKHIRTGKLYKHLLDSFDTETQKHHVVYLQIETGHVFNRDADVFDDNFVLVEASPQFNITPFDKKRK